MNRRAAQAGSATEPAIEISIDELVLHGFSGVDRGRLDAALRGELGRLLQDPELAAALRNPRQAAPLNLQTPPMKGSASPEHIGVQVARALVRSWQPAPSQATSASHGKGAGSGQEKGRRP